MSIFIILSKAILQPRFSCHLPKKQMSTIFSYSDLSFYSISHQISATLFLSFSVIISPAQSVTANVDFQKVSVDRITGVGSKSLPADIKRLQEKEMKEKRREKENKRKEIFWFGVYLQMCY